MAYWGVRFTDRFRIDYIGAMKWARAMGRMWSGALAMTLALAYCLSTTQLAYPFHEWLESRAIIHHSGHGVAGQEIYPCAIHKCQCKNALQCKTKCCCFPKASAFRGHGGHSGHGLFGGGPDNEGKDRLTAALTACGGMADVDGLLPVPVAWLSPAPRIELPETAVDDWTTADFAAPPSPGLQAPFKVPISA